MGMSLQDQLLKAGIADKKQANKARQEKRTKRKKNKGKKDRPEINQVQQQRQAQARRSQELNRQINQEKEKLEKRAQARQLIETHRLDLRKYEEPYYFTVGKKIKKIYVDETITKKLSKGQLAVVTLDDRYEVVPSEVAKQVADRDGKALILLYEPE